MKLAINGSRARSGGAQSHLIGIISNAVPLNSGINEVHLWCDKNLQEKIPNKSWLVKHYSEISNQPILNQLLWEKFYLPKLIRKYKCDFLFNVHAGSLCRFNPSITMSQDMLAFEKGEADRFGFSKERLRLFLLKRIHLYSLKNSTANIFLTSYAQKIISKELNSVNPYKIIPHGVSENFNNLNKKKILNPNQKEINILYVSPIWLFKHQWEVVKAVEKVRSKNFNLKLTLVGGFEEKAFRKLKKQMFLSESKAKFVNYLGHIPHIKLPDIYKKADIFIFASSCENMPISLIEAMRSGLPILCSNRGPMPEVLRDGGLYFDPENYISIAKTIEKLLFNRNLLFTLPKRSKELSKHYTWDRCVNETLEYVKEIGKSCQDK